MLNYHLNTAETRKETRYQSCRVLEDHQISCVIWFEDALHHHGVPTVVFDLYVLVPDIERAADCLIKAGWTVDTRHLIGNAEVTVPQQPLISPDRQTKTVLLPASDWKFPLTTELSLERVPLVDEVLGRTVPFPPLSGLLDALIESWLDGPSENETLLLHLAAQFNYLYEYAPALKERSFADQMKYEHRQFHYDVLAGMESSTFPFRRHQQGIREALLQGRYELQECSASRDNKQLFDSWAGVRLPPPPASEESAD